MDFDNYEKIERLLLQPARFLKFKNVVMLGKKSANKEKIQPIYEKSYNSGKYSNYNSLKTIHLDTSDFFTIAYNRDKVFEEIYLSYPHLSKLIKGFREATDILNGDVEDGNGNTINIFTEINGELYLNEKYADLNVKVGGLIGGKSIVLTFDVLKNDLDGREMKGALLYIGTDTNIVELNEDALNGILYFLENFNLLLCSQHSFSTAYEYIESKGVTRSSTPSSKTYASPTGSKRSKQPRSKSSKKNVSTMFEDDEDEDIIVKSSPKSVIDENDIVVPDNADERYTDENLSKILSGEKEKIKVNKYVDKNDPNDLPFYDSRIEEVEDDEDDGNGLLSNTGGGTSIINLASMVQGMEELDNEE